MSYIPTKEADFVEWSENLITVSTANKTLWNLPEDKLAALSALHNEVKALHAKCQTVTYTKLDMQEKKEKKKELVHLEEVFVRNNLQNNDAMNDSGRRNLRIPIYDKTPTAHPAPESIPYIEIETPHPRTLRIKFRDEHAPRWGKPAHVHGLECLWNIRDTPPEKMKDLLHSSFATRSPLELVFEEDERGKKVYLAVRWETGAVQKGLWSDIVFAIIP
ncbi:MAG: hypothetical protein LBB80_04790 [Treponema sp.]|jgi:hypothetical protein|nr:hypothetical protein [Treponema sp.]